MWLFSFMKSSRPPHDNGSYNSGQVSSVSLMSVLIKAWTVFIMTTANPSCIAWTTIITILVCLHAVTAPNYLHIHDMETSLVNYINYWKYFKFGHYIWTPPSKLNIKHRCFTPSTDCTNFASNECYACVSCCYVCNPTPAAMTTPEAMYRLASKEILPRHDTTTTAVLWPGHYICEMKVN